MLEIKFQDLRKRDWEIFLDIGYYDMFCVRCTSVKEGKSFNSHLSFHFDTKDEAIAFSKLIKKAR